MKIKVNDLQQTLNKGLVPIYIISGDEPFQKEEANTKIKDVLIANGFKEKIIFHIDDRFDWNRLQEISVSLSLFSQKRIIEIRLLSFNYINLEANAALLFYAKHVSQQNVLILICEKVNKNIEKSAWFTHFEKLGVWIPVWNIEGKYFERWVQNRVKHAGFSISPESLTLLIEKTEGNLLACAQEIEKLKLLISSKKITFNHVKELVADNAHYNVFNLTETIILGKKKSAINMLNKLYSEGVELAVMLWMFARELKIINHIACLLMADQKNKLDDAAKKTSVALKVPFFILKNRMHAYYRCIQRLGVSTIQQLIVDVSKLDLFIKIRDERINKMQFCTLVLKALGVGHKTDLLNISHISMDHE